MKQYVGLNHFFKKFSAIAISLLLGQLAFAQSLDNQKMVFEGSLTDDDGNPIDLSTAELTFYVTANNCYLYGEASSTSGDSSGNIIHRIGSHTPISGSPNTYTQNLFFGNVSGTTTFAGNDCFVNATHTRLIQVSYLAENITATMKIGTVPYAQNANTLSGKTASDFILASTDSNTLFSGGSAGQFLTKSTSGLTWTNSTITSAAVTSALGYTPSSSTVTLNNATVTTALGYLPASATSIATLAVRANNLSDLASATVARVNLELGSLATKSSINLSGSETVGTLPATRLPSFSGDVSTSVGSSTTTVQALRGVALSNTAPVSGQILYYNGFNWGAVTIPQNFGTVTNVTSTNSDIVVTSQTTTPKLTLNAGTGANQIIRLDGAAKIPAIDASQLISLNATQLTSGTIPTGRLPILTGDVSSLAGSNTITVNKIRGIVVSSTIPTANQVLAFSAGQWVPTTFPGGSVTNINAGTGLLGGSITSAGTISVNFGSSAGTVASGNDPRLVQALQSVNNLSDITSASTARANLGLGSLATKSTINLASEVSGILPAINGGSKWSQSSGNIYATTNVGIGTNTPSFRLHVTAPAANSYIAAFTPMTGSSFYGIGEDNMSQLYTRMKDATGVERVLFSASGTNFINNSLVVGSGVNKIGDNNLTVYGNSIITGKMAVSKTLVLDGSSSVPIQFAAANTTVTAVPGSIEYDGSHLLFTDSLSQRRRLAGGLVSGTIDNVFTIGYASGSLTLEGSRNSFTNGAIVINNTGTGGVALQATGHIIVSGSIKLSGDGSNTITTCTANDEGKQRYNSTHKVMEFCDGSYWQGTTGVTHCSSPTSGYGSGLQYTLIGKAGSGEAFCMSKLNELNDYIDAVDDCTNRIATNGSRMGLCEEKNYLNACKQYSDFGASAESKLTNFKGVFYWTNSLYLTGSPPNYSAIGFNLGTTNVCNISYKDEDARAETTNTYYRCCYQ